MSPVTTADATADAPDERGGGVRAAPRVRHSWTSVVADVLIAAAIGGTIIYVPITTARIRRLESATAEIARLRMDTQSLGATVRRNIQSSGLEGTSLPSELAAKVRRVLGHGQRKGFKSVLLFAYGPDVCERTLREGLQSLARNDSAGEHRSPAIAIVGVLTEADREHALLLKAQGILQVPIVMISADSLPAPAGFRHDTAAAQEPLVLRVDKRLTITAVFHVDQLRPKLLDDWLAATRQPSETR